MGVKALRRIEMADEVTKGTVGTYTTSWRGVGTMPDDQRTITFPSEEINLVVPTNRIYTPRHFGNLSFAQTEATFEQLPYILSAGVENIITGTQDGTGPYVYTYSMGTTTIPDITTYSLKAGDDTAVEQMLYCFVTDFTLSANAGEAVMVQANWAGQGPTAGAAFTDPAIPAVEDILAQLGQLWIEDEGGTFEATAMSNTILSFELAVNTGRTPKWFIDGNSKEFGVDYYNYDNVSAVATIVFEHDATSTAFKADWRAETGKMIQVLFEGSTIAGGSDYNGKALEIRMTGNFERFEPLTDQEGNNIYRATFRMGYSATDAVSPLEIIVANSLTALT